jgi:hypothetical protein
MIWLTQKRFRLEMQSMLREHQVECSAQIAQLAANVAVLETSAQNADNLSTGALSRSTRSQAMQLLRSGMSPENVAASLGLGRREMRLLASVSRTLHLK